MRLIIRVFLLVAALIAVLFALNNRDPVGISLWPFPFEMQLPLFLALIAALMLGVALGAALAWAGQARHRRRARAGQHELARQQREIEALRVKNLQSGAPRPAAKNLGQASLPPPL